MYDNETEMKKLISQHNSMLASNFYLSNYKSNFAHLQTNHGIGHNNTKLKSSHRRVLRSAMTIRKPHNDTTT